MTPSPQTQAAGPRLLDGSTDRCDSCGCDLLADYVAVGLSFYCCWECREAPEMQAAA